MNQTIPSATSAQIALRTASAVLLTLGALAALSGLGLLKRRGRQRADKISAGWAAAGLAMLLGGSVLYFIGLPPPPEPEVISSTRFSSDAFPCLTIDMPSGWTLSHHRPAGRLTATDAHATLFIETSLVTDGIDPLAFIKLVSDRTRAAGGTVGERFDEPIDGFNAVGLPITIASSSTNVWYIPRGGPLLTVITCRTESPAKPTEGCRGPLRTLKWRAPGPL